MAWTGRCALDGVRGERWALQTTGSIRSSPALAGELVVVGSDDGVLYAADRRNGALRWRVALDSPVTGSPTVDGDRVFVTTAGNRLWALGVADGTPLWSVDGGTSVRLRGARTCSRPRRCWPVARSCSARPTAGSARWIATAARSHGRSTPASRSGPRPVPIPVASWSAACPATCSTWTTTGG
ncbi:PQQ-like beta-propeller repeat protein [Pseudoxanthomonas sp. NC8]|nr:PQQ-like beta-propeller repeat protein [Pseudoxanthomonas sp. NC8]